MSFQFIRRNARQAFLNLRLLVAVTFCSAGLLLGLFAFNATASDRALNVGAASTPRLGATTPAGASKIAPWVHNHTANGQQAEFLVVLSDQADLTDAKKIKTKLERRRRVRDELWNKADQTQRPILQWLRQRNIEHRPFYIVNAIWVKADGKTAAALAMRPDVLRVEGNPPIRNVIDPEEASASTVMPNATTAVETGIAYSHAPQVWALGYTGQGIVVGGADTGCRWTHEALKNQYRGWNGSVADHDYNWHDSIHSGAGTCGHDSIVPCDDHSHGTHTIGTAVGSDGGNNQIGMAPGAKWIGCRNMDNGVGTPARYIECMEFFLAPYPVGGTTAQGDADKAPDISTNSWSCPASEGCSANTLQAAVEAQRAAGIFMVAAAGNDGPGCHTIVDPPGIYEAIYTIGALNTGSDNIASFSSRGTVTSDGSSRRKPDLCAPGNTVRSATNATNTSYASFQGTSMATPHVAGAVALLWSAQPLLRNDIASTIDILNQSAVPIGANDCDAAGGIPNNTFGYGRLDAKAAVDVAFLTTIAPVITRQGNPVTLTFYAGLNRTYRLERKFDLTEAVWSPVPGANDLVATSDGPAPLTDPDPGNDHGFYHVRLVQ